MMPMSTNQQENEPMTINYTDEQRRQNRAAWAELKAAGISAVRQAELDKDNDEWIARHRNMVTVTGQLKGA